MTQELLEAQKAEEAAMGVLTTAKAIVVTTAEEYTLAGARYAEIKQALKNLEAQRVAITGPINQSLDLINAGFKKPKLMLEEALKLYNDPMVAFKQAEARRIAQAEEAARKERERLEAEARAKAKEEEAKLQKAHEEAEAARKAAEAMADEDPLGAMLAEDEAKEKEAEAAAAFEATQAAIREAAHVDIPVVYVPKASAAGTSFRKTWKWRITDPKKIPREYLLPNEVMIGAMVRSTKDQTNIPGIEVYSEDKIGG